MIDNKFIEKLWEVVKFVFDNEEAFLEKFFPKYEDVELSGFYTALELLATSDIIAKMADQQKEACLKATLTGAKLKGTTIDFS